MSHLQGTDYVGSMVVFEDALAKKSDYRRFAVRHVDGNDDYAAMEEVLTRRLTALLAERGERAERGGVPERAERGGVPEPDDAAAGTALDEGAAGTLDGAEAGGGPAAGEANPLDEAPAVRRSPRRFAYPPQLLLLDGGKGQLGVGERVLASLGLAGEIELAALAKQFEEVYRPGRADPVRIPRGSEALYLLQRVRDEAHRFAVSFHRERRGKRMTSGVLDGIPGLGPARRSRLLREMGGVRSLRAAERGDLRDLGWLPDQVADRVFDALHDPGGGVFRGPVRENGRR